MLGGKESYMGHIKLYTITGCTHCERIKRFLDRLCLVYEEVNVFEYPERQEDLFKLVGEFQVPLVVYNDSICTEEVLLNSKFLKMNF